MSGWITDRLRRRPFRGWHDWRLGVLYWLCMLLALGMAVYGVWHKASAR